jgi:hypothetical protein
MVPGRAGGWRASGLADGRRIVAACGGAARGAFSGVPARADPRGACQQAAGPPGAPSRGGTRPSHQHAPHPCLQTVVVDCRGHMLGRLASTLAKQLLSGQHVVSGAAGCWRDAAMDGGQRAGAGGGRRRPDALHVAPPPAAALAAAEAASVGTQSGIVGYRRTKGGDWQRQAAGACPLPAALRALPLHPALSCPRPPGPVLPCCRCACGARRSTSAAAW